MEEPKMYVHCIDCKKDYPTKEKGKANILWKTLFPSGNAKETYYLVRFNCPKGHNTSSILRDEKGRYYLVDDKGKFYIPKKTKQKKVKS